MYSFQYIPDELIAICKELSAIYHCRVWPAKRHLKDDDLSNDVTLVCETQRHDIHTYKGYSVHCIYNNTSTLNNEAILSLDEDKRIGDILSQHADVLFENHSNITMMCPSAVKITNFQMMSSKCISICCKGKGFVPIGDSIFPREIGGITVDVREGYTAPCTIDTLHDCVKVSCSIAHKQAKNYGTIGGFCSEKGDGNGSVKHGLLTCCHCVTYPGMTSLADVMGGIVFQPGIGQHSETNECGIVKYINLGNIDYEDGIKYFMDATVIDMKKFPNRKPHDDSFCDALLTCMNKVLSGLFGQNFSFNKVSIHEPISDIQGKTVYKIGTRTGCKAGKVYSQKSVGNLNYEYIGNKKYLNVILIKPHETEKFADSGDSGSLVFYKENEHVHIVGLLFGTTADGGGVACHIKPILDRMEIQFSNFKSRPK